ncbi:MAG: SDR family NAD(P)-dependent oxidoreductase [Chitinophagales bacterium]|jgi:short-subunit dehydrogenase|nr:SDR family NAD(P)-dependent oxidoreductase [Sphingobacteriales bacterium]
MKLDFKNKWVLVTGASSGLGKAICMELALKEGANLIMVARRLDRLNELKNSIKLKSAVKIEVISTDLTQENEINSLAQILEKTYNIYAAVINAGMTLMKKQNQITEEETRNIIDLNIRSTIHLTNYFIAHFQKRNSNGGLLYISSLSSGFPTPYQSLYSGTKAFLNNFILALSQEHAQEKFSFSIYAPGGISTDMTNNVQVKHLEKFLKRPADCARTAIYGFKLRKLLFSSYTSIELLFADILPIRLKLYIMRKLYERKN